MTQIGEQDKWYAVHTYSGYEERVKKNLDQRIGSMDANHDILKVVIPTEEEVEVKNGQKRTVTRKILQYTLVHMKMNDFSWSIEISGVTGL